MDKTARQVVKCEHCGKNFQRERTLATHLCEARRRWETRQLPVGQIALVVYNKFYTGFQPSQKNKTWEEFSSSRYYTAFVRFAQYMLDINCVSIPAYTDYVIGKKIPLDRWSSDKVYGDFLKTWNRCESAWDAVKRSLVTADSWAEKSSSTVGDYFRYATDSCIINDIMRGKLSAWLIYNCDTGVNWLSNQHPSHLDLIYPFVDPDHWGKIIAESAEVTEITQLLKQVGM